MSSKERWLRALSKAHVYWAEMYRTGGKPNTARHALQLHIARREQARTLAKQAKAVKP